MATRTKAKTTFHHDPDPATYTLAIPPRLDEALRDIVKYLEHDERHHWEECDRPKNHIWHSVKQLRAALPDKT